MHTICSIFSAISLDGFLTREDGSLDWLASVASASHDYGYRQYLSSTDAMLISYADMKSLLSTGIPVPDTCFVYTEEQLSAIAAEKLPSAIRLIQGNAISALQQISASGFRNIAVEGREAIQALLSESLISRMTLTLAPVLLGKGIRLFGELTEDQYWQLQSSQAFDDGLIQLCYEQSL